MEDCSGYVSHPHTWTTVFYFRPENNLLFMKAAVESVWDVCCLVIVFRTNISGTERHKVFLKKKKEKECFDLLCSDWPVTALLLSKLCLLSTNAGLLYSSKREMRFFISWKNSKEYQENSVEAIFLKGLSFHQIPFIYCTFFCVDQYQVPVKAPMKLHNSFDK